MIRNKLKNFVRKAPTKTGVYTFTSQNKEELYIGKALNLKNRVSQYLKVADVRLQQMISRAERVDFVKTDSEIEALILESQYIKKYKPAFNIMLRDDKNFFYVVFTHSTGSTSSLQAGSGQAERFPKILITHQPFDSAERKRRVVLSLPKDNRSASLRASPAKFIGPFTDGTALKTTLRYLRGVFPYCTCKQSHNNYCLNYHIGKCPGFCCLKDGPERSQSIAKEKEYRKNIKAIKDILSGKKTSLLKRLEKEMVKMGKKERFQEAIELRDKIEKIKRVFENARIIQNIPYYDISNNYSGNTLLELKKFLKLKQLPHRIEGYDIANIQGKYAVGSMVVFSDGKPDKSKYRKFKIRRILSSDLSTKALATAEASREGEYGDTGMLREVLARRFRHPEWPMPDLIVVDGGKQQLHVAEAVVNSKQIQNSKFKIPNIIALTKDERHKGIKVFIQNKKEAIPLSKLPTGVKNLLLQVDSEAHRFAISYYRNLHRKSFKQIKVA